MLLGGSLGLGGLSGDLGGSLGLSLGGLGSGLLGVLSSTLGLLGSLGLSGGLASSLGLGGLGLAGGLGGSGLLELGSSGATELVGEALDASTGVNELLLAGWAKCCRSCSERCTRRNPGGYPSSLQDSFLLRAWLPTRQWNSPGMVRRCLGFRPRLQAFEW